MRPTILLLLLPLLTGCMPPRSTAAPAARATPEAVLAAERRWFDALVERDTATLGQLLAPEFVLSGSAAELESRAQYLETAQMPERTLEPIELDDRRVRIHDSTAVSTGRAQLRGRWRERPLAFRFRYTNVYVLRAGRWQAVASHVSVVE